MDLPPSDLAWFSLAACALIPINSEVLSSLTPYSTLFYTLYSCFVEIHIVYLVCCSPTNNNDRLSSAHTCVPALTCNASNVN